MNATLRYATLRCTALVNGLLIGGVGSTVGILNRTHCGMESAKPVRCLAEFGKEKGCLAAAPHATNLGPCPVAFVPRESDRAARREFFGGGADGRGDVGRGRVDLLSGATASWRRISIRPVQGSATIKARPSVRRSSGRWARSCIWCTAETTST